MRRTAPGLALFTLASALSLAACGEDRTGTSVQGDVVLADVALFDTAKADTLFGGTLPPDFGEPCDNNSECTTGFCVEGPNGFVCSKTCTEACPTGYSCKGITSGSVDLVFVCVPDGDPVTDVVETDVNTVDTASGPDTSPIRDTLVEDTGPFVDTYVPPVGNLCDLDPGVGTESFFTEPQGGSEWPDCITGCPNAAHVGLVELTLAGVGATSGALGVLDGGEHDYDDVGVGPDIDVVALRAPPRTMVEVAVQAGVGGSPIDPLIYTSDGFQIRTFSSDVAPGNTCARTTLVFPFVSSSAIYVAVEDGRNYDLWTPDGYSPGTVGGSQYKYTLRLRATAFAPVEVGTLAAGQTQQLTGQVVAMGGDTKYYHFVAPANATPQVTVARTGGADFVPAIAVFKSDQEQMVWNDVEWDADGNGNVSLSGGFTVCNGNCGSAPSDFYFAVFDYNGAAGPGTFGYNVTVKLN